MNKNQSPQSALEPQSRIRIGKIATAHGVRGLVKVKIEVDDLALFDYPLFKSATSDDILDLTLQNSGGKFWIAKVGDIIDRNQAELLRGTEIWIDKTALPKIETDDEFYVADLIGLDVQDHKGKAIGSVIDIADFGAGTFLEIKPLAGAAFYLMFNDENVPEIDDVVHLSANALDSKIS